jgi:hypothetical protein
MPAQLVLRSKQYFVKFNVLAAQARLMGRAAVWRTTGTVDKTAH